MTCCLTGEVHLHPDNLDKCPRHRLFCFILLFLLSPLLMDYGMLRWQERLRVQRAHLWRWHSELFNLTKCTAANKPCPPHYCGVTFYRHSFWNLQCSIASNLKVSSNEPRCPLSMMEMQKWSAAASQNVFPSQFNSPALWPHDSSCRLILHE